MCLIFFSIFFSFPGYQIVTVMLGTLHALVSLYVLLYMRNEVKDLGDDVGKVMHVFSCHIIMPWILFLSLLLFFSHLFLYVEALILTFVSLPSRSAGWAMLCAIPCALKLSSSHGHGTRVGPIDRPVQRRSSRF